MDNGIVHKYRHVRLIFMWGFLMSQLTCNNNFNFFLINDKTKVFIGIVKLYATTNDIINEFSS